MTKEVVQPAQAQSIPLSPPVLEPVPATAAVPDSEPAQKSHPVASMATPKAESPTVEQSVAIPDPGVLDKYRLALIDGAKRYRRYPIQAMDRGWEGRVEIRLVFGADGMVKTAAVKTSSRYAILDHQALDMVKKGISVARVPAALTGREFTVDVPVVFELRTG